MQGVDTSEESNLNLFVNISTYYVSLKKKIRFQNFGEVWTVWNVCDTEVLTSFRL